MSCGSTLRTACEVECLIESSCALSVRFCVCAEGPQRRADTDLRIPLVHKQVQLKDADLCPTPFEKGSALWRRSINPQTCQWHQAKLKPAHWFTYEQSGQVPANVFGRNEPFPAVSQSRSIPASVRIKFVWDFDWLCLLGYFYWIGVIGEAGVLRWCNRAGVPADLRAVLQTEDLAGLLCFKEKPHHCDYWRCWNVMKHCYQPHIIQLPAPFINFLYVN